MLPISYTLLSISSGTYADNQLYKTITTDENGAATHEFKDKEGRVVLKRTFGTSMVNNSPVNEAHDTYYVYDNFGNLTYVLPPLSLMAL